MSPDFGSDTPMFGMQIPKIWETGSPLSHAYVIARRDSAMAEYRVANASCLRQYLSKSVDLDPDIFRKDVEPLDCEAERITAGMCKNTLMHDPASNFAIKQ